MRTIRKISSFTLLALALASPSAARADDKAADEAKRKEAELAAINALNASGSAIDACTAAYAVEYPAAKGTARIDAKVAKDGSVVSASVATTLDGARNLRPCLEKVAKGWRLPPHTADEPQPLSLTVPVYKGAKFVIPKPGEKAQAQAPAGESTPEAAYNLSPAAFTPSWNESK